MSEKPDFATITKTQLRAYVLAHRDEEQALQAYMDKLHAESPNLRVYKAEDNVAEAIAEYLNSRKSLHEAIAISGSRLDDSGRKGAIALPMLNPS